MRALLFHNILRSAEDKLDLRDKDRSHTYIYTHTRTSIQETNRPFRRSGYTGPLEHSTQERYYTWSIRKYACKVHEADVKEEDNGDREQRR